MNGSRTIQDFMNEVTDTVKRSHKTWVLAGQSFLGKRRRRVETARAVNTAYRWERRNDFYFRQKL